MKNSRTTLKVLYYFLSAFILSCFPGCKEDHAQNYGNRVNTMEVKGMKGTKAGIFVNYLDSLVKLPDEEFNESSITSLNKRFVSELPLAMYDSIKRDNGQDILIQYYKNNEIHSELESGIRFLMPTMITDSLSVSDFTHHFGDITDEKPSIGITKQPLPVHIRISSDREMKLTFRNDANRQQAGVTMVEILNYR